MGTGSEVIVVGGGHNGLICAAYLARAGVETLVVEARTDVGGCASTVPDLGARFNICNCDHTMIRAMPIADELELAAYGLRYLEPEASFIHQFHDHSTPWLFFHDTERHLDGLAATHPGSIEGYRRYLRDALPVAQLIIDMARTKPSAPQMLRRAAPAARAATRLLHWSRKSAAAVLQSYFDDWHLWAPAVATGPTVWGVPPETPGTGLAAALYATRHLVSTGRPEGGSGALTDATRRSFEAAGGRVVCDARVDRVVIDRGRACGVRLTDGTMLRAEAVVAATDPRRVFTEWVDDVPAAAKRRADRWRRAPEADGYESKIDAVLSERPALVDVQTDIEALGPTTVISPAPDELEAAHRLRTQGLVAERPTMLVNVPSVLDPTLAPAPGQEILSLEVLFTPYAHPGGWPASGEPQRWLDVWGDFVGPGFDESVVRWRAMTPDRYEAEFSMHRGHTPAYGGSPVAAVLGRQRELTRYRSGVPGLYLTGAGTFPGAGIFGASGRNVADVVLTDRRRSRPRRRLAAGAGR